MLLFTPCLPALFASIGHFVVNAEFFCPRKWGLVGRMGTGGEPIFCCLDGLRWKWDAAANWWWSYMMAL